MTNTTQQNNENNNNIDYEFKRISNEDFTTTDETLSTTVASISTRQMQEVDSISNNLYTKIQIPESFRIDAKPYIERPFYVGSVKFPSNADRYSWLQTPVKFLPGDVIRSNLALLNAMKIGSLYRADLVLNISLAGTITHAGCVLVSVLPPLNTYPNAVAGDVRLINSMLTSPHAFLYANEATSVNLTVPWYCNTDLATLNMDLTNETTMDLNPITGNYASLVFMVLNPLSPSTGSSTELTIVIEACFKNLDILVPTPRFATWQSQSGIKGLIDTTKKGLKEVSKDFLDKGINSLFGMLGLHNPNDATISERDILSTRNFLNTVDSTQFFEKLDPFSNFNRIMQSPVFGSDVDEMAISHITSKRQFLGSFKVNKDDPVGKLYWIRPISPFQGGINDQNELVECANNIELLHSLHRAWRGDLKIIITSVMNNKQQCKLKLLKLYNPPKNALTTVPTYQSIANAPSHLMEFTQGGQEHEVVLPFLSRNQVIPCSENLNFEAFAHGLYYIYLAQPLANSDGSPTSIEFNIYMEGLPNLTFYGYTMKYIVTENHPFPPNNTSFRSQSGSPIKVMNEPQIQEKTSNFDVKNQNSNFMDRLVPNLDLRPLVRRMYTSASEILNVPPVSGSHYIINLASLVSEEGTLSPYPKVQTPIAAISNMYYGKNVGFKFSLNITRFKLDDSKPELSQDVRVYYIPPGLTLEGNNLTMCGMGVNPTAVDQNPVPQYTLFAPVQLTPVQHQTYTDLYEFSIPDVTYFKYMGSPNKLSSGSADLPLATSDFGKVYIFFMNNTQEVESVNKITYSFGLTDETRFGHHSLATVFRIIKIWSPYLEISGTTPIGTRNPNIYKGFFL